MKFANILIKLSARIQEPRTKIPRKILRRILNPPRYQVSRFLAENLIKLLEMLIKASNILIKLFES